MFSERRYVGVTNSNREETRKARMEVARAIRAYLACSSDIREVERDLQDICGILFQEELARRDADQNADLLENLKRLIAATPKIMIVKDQYYEISPAEVKKSGLYDRLINASIVSRILLISGKEQTEERIMDIWDSKGCSGTTESSDPRCIGRALESKAFDNFNKANANRFRKSGVWVNSFAPTLCAQPDGIRCDSERVIATLELKVLTQAGSQCLDIILGELHRSSELGMRYDPKESALEIRKGSPTYQQMQCQMFCTGAPIGYLAIYNPVTNELQSRKIVRDEEFIKWMVEASSVKLPEILKTVGMSSEPEKVDEKFPLNDNELLPFGKFLSGLSSPKYM